MTIKGNFCSSPWLHMRILSTGSYGYCRWAYVDNLGKTDLPSIREQAPIEFFQKTMAPVRQQLLNGNSPDFCHNCLLMEQHKKISGRQRQLLKIGVDTDHFTESFLSSPWIPAFKYSADHCGDTTQTPQDWQIDLGNHCNNACIFCKPVHSSRLAAEFKKLGLIENLPPASWCEDPALLEEFLQMLCQSTSLRYLHFIGGETLVTPAFRKILEALIDANLQSVTIGLTTNLAVWDQSIIDLLAQFDQVNLGMSIECLHPLNEYLRYGSEYNRTREILDQWVELAKTKNWYMQLRVTPTVFSIWHLDTIYEYAYANKISVECCNFLNEPSYMRPSILSADLRNQVINKISTWADKFSNDRKLVVNVRNPHFAEQQIIDDAVSYVNYLRNQDSESDRLPELVSYIKLLESNRHNSILDYLPEYEDFLRSAGY